MYATKLAILLAATTAAPAFAQATSPADFVKQAGASDLYECESSQLVLATSKDAHVRGYAQHMIKDHTKSTADVKAAAMKAGLHPAPPKLNATQTDDIGKLRIAKGEARDKLYMQQQAASHQEALALHKGYAQHGTSAPLKMAAAKIAPVVQEHIDMLNKGGM